MALSSHAADVMMPSINLQLTRGRHYWHYSPITTKCITMSHKQHNICQRNGEMMSATKINTRHGKNTVGISIYMIIDCIQIISPLLRTHFQVTFLCQLFDTEYLRWLRILLFMTLHSDVLRSGQRRQRVQWSAGRLQRETGSGQYLSVCHKKLLVWGL